MASKTPVSHQVLAFVAGAALAAGGDIALRRPAQRRWRVPILGAALPVVAAVYPLFRSSPGADPDAVRREYVAVGLAGAVAAGSAFLPAGAARDAVAAGWAAHAAFDVLHAQDQTSTLPRWYPAMCAGYDLSVAALLRVR